MKPTFAQHFGYHSTELDIYNYKTIFIPSLNLIYTPDNKTDWKLDENYTVILQLVGHCPAVKHADV